MSTFQHYSSYSEAAYFGGDHCHHCAARDEILRVERRRVEAIRYLDRRSSSRNPRLKWG